MTDSSYEPPVIPDDPLLGLINHFEEQADLHPVETIGGWFDSNARKHHYEEIKAPIWWRIRARRSKPPGNSSNI